MEVPIPMDTRIPLHPGAPRGTLGLVADLKHHLPGEWWRELFDSLHLRTDGDVVENDVNTIAEVDLLVQSTAAITRVSIFAPIPRVS